ncbi:MAG TPA: hypothetical protein DCS93_15260 [Microscillaceae bacterium]|nr:hypothetical protein [Microscillaceae bacterium]
MKLRQMLDFKAIFFPTILIIICIQSYVYAENKPSCHVVDVVDARTNEVTPLTKYLTINLHISIQRYFNIAMSQVSDSTLLEINKRDDKGINYLMEKSFFLNYLNDFKVDFFVIPRFKTKRNGMSRDAILRVVLLYFENKRVKYSISNLDLGDVRSLTSEKLNNSLNDHFKEIIDKLRNAKQAKFRIVSEVSFYSGRRYLEDSIRNTIVPIGTSVDVFRLLNGGFVELTINYERFTTLENFYFLLGINNEYLLSNRLSLRSSFLFGLRFTNFFDSTTDINNFLGEGKVRLFYTLDKTISLSLGLGQHFFRTDRTTSLPFYLSAGLSFYIGKR